ncbi:hypothetical protein SAMN04488082_101400 [Desulfomicrobium apsheronum]|uniref:Transposase n=1 Tax=Desulfomicrobium apsheronum TaxID=52560 RepID=A0A1I3NVP5_9BACT|nr:hypothetical protein [Desulfomicrobium apsheronum]SFJ13192.1 hypothetical protein SAMN04488082_101400 [Desulfomicrobium apsheronum]
MTKWMRRKHSAEFKVKVVLVAMAGDKTLAELASRFELNQITEWKRQFSERAAAVFGESVDSEQAVNLTVLHAKIGQLTLKNTFLERCIQQGKTAESKWMIRNDLKVQNHRLIKLVRIRRGCVYSQLRSVGETFSTVQVFTYCRQKCPGVVHF